MPDSDADATYSADRLVYWIGGSPGAGKSSVTRALAQRHGLWTYYCDWHQLGMSGSALTAPMAFLL